MPRFTPRLIITTATAIVLAAASAAWLLWPAGDDGPGSTTAAAVDPQRRNALQVELESIITDFEGLMESSSDGLLRQQRAHDEAGALIERALGVGESIRALDDITTARLEAEDATNAKVLAEIRAILEQAGVQDLELPSWPVTEHRPLATDLESLQARSDEIGRSIEEVRALLDAPPSPADEPAPAPAP